MAAKLPTNDEIKAIAKANHFSLSDAELRMITTTVPGIFAAADKVDADLAEPQPSVIRYKGRDPGSRPTRAQDPLNAIVRRCRVRGASAGKLAGKRIGLKDSVMVAGIPASAGSHVLQGYVPDNDATIVGRMLDAGAEIVAMLNMDDFALSGDGTTSAYGPTLNPHNPQHCCGGSSSGSAAALYYDDIDLTIGTDQGGSIRIPSSWSGVVGIKATYGLVPYTGVMSIDPTMDHVGPMGRTVADVALLLEVIAGRDPLDPRQDEVPVEQYRDALSKSVAGLSIGILREGFEHDASEPDVNAAVRKAVAELAKQGAIAEEISIPHHRDAYQFIWTIIAEGMAQLAATNLVGTHHHGLYYPSLADYFGSHVADRADQEASTVKFFLVLGNLMKQRYRGRIYAKAQNLRDRFASYYDSALERFDVLAMPTTPNKAIKQGQQAPYSMVGNTAPFDVTGHPGLSVPCAMSNGLPVGLMLIGRYFQESTLFRIGQAYEQAVDWRKA
ncbi:MAG: amidase [Candidatus Binataceae bacterium]